MNSRRRGSILLLSMFFLVSLAFLAFAVLRLLPTDQRAALHHVMDTQSTFAADAGIHCAMERIEWQYRLGAGTVAENLTVPLTGTPFVANATITPDAQTLANATKRVFYVTSTAYRVDLGGAKALRTINATLSNDSFAKWVWFHDLRPTDLYLPLDSWTFDGPLHFNSPIRVSGVNSAFYSGSHVPFLSKVTSATRIESTGESGVPSWATLGDGVKYNNPMSNTPYDTTTGSQDPAKYSKLYALGRDALTTGIAPVQMPTNFDKIKAGAWGASTGYPSSAGVYANLKSGTQELAGGLYVNADVKQMQLGVNANQNGDTRIRIYEGSTLYEYHFVDVTDATDLVAARANGLVTATTTATVGQSYLTKQKVNNTGTNLIQTDGSGGTLDAGNITVQSFVNNSNGVIFSTGDIQKLWGENKNKKTITADLETKKQIFIVDDLTRKDTPVNGTSSFEGAYPSTPAGQAAFKPTGSRDTLGLVAWKIRLPADTSMKYSALPASALALLGLPATEGRSDANPLYVYATLYAGHKLDSTQALWNSTDEMGGLYDDATDVGGADGILHLFGGMQLAYKNATQMELDLHYDPILARSPPPYYPSYDRMVILRWREYPLPD